MIVDVLGNIRSYTLHDLVSVQRELDNNVDRGFFQSPAALHSQESEAPAGTGISSQEKEPEAPAGTTGISSQEKECEDGATQSQECGQRHAQAQEKPLSTIHVRPRKKRRRGFHAPRFGTCSTPGCKRSIPSASMIFCNACSTIHSETS